VHRGEICPHGNLEFDHPALQECSNSREQLLFLTCLTLKTKTLYSFKMLRTTCPTMQHHNPAHWNIFYTRFMLAKNINLLVPELFFLILAHPVYKMLITQEPNKLELWNKLHFEEKKTESITPCLKYSVPISVE